MQTDTYEGVPSLLPRIHALSGFSHSTKQKMGGPQTTLCTSNGLQDPNSDPNSVVTTFQSYCYSSPLLPPRFKYKSDLLPWLVWFSGLSAGLLTERLPFRIPGQGAHAWVAGQVPSGGCERGNHTLMFLSHINVSLPFSLISPLSKNKNKSLKVVY